MPEHNRMTFNNLCDALDCLVFPVHNTMPLFSVPTNFIPTKINITPELTRWYLDLDVSYFGSAVEFVSS